MLRRPAFGSGFALVMAGVTLLGGAGCAKTSPSAASEPEAQDTGIAAPEVVPRVINATPVAEVGEFAGNVDGQPPLVQARVYYAQGQLWMSRLVLETKALGPTATKEETELLLKICQEQHDLACLEACSKKLGRKIPASDGGGSVASGTAAASAAPPVRR